MKLGKGIYDNFASYNYLFFDYNGLGLSLLSGDTGSGKSTLMDAASWCLFGQTGKGAAADDVCKWGSRGPTTGMQVVQIGNSSITVNRCRGSVKQNDLFWTENGGDGQEYRGKDLTETQRLLEKRLGISAEVYFMAAYFHQFSQADNFFVAKAKDRRNILEQVCDLLLPVRIGAEATKRRNTEKTELIVLANRLSVITGRLQLLNENRIVLKKDHSIWESDRHNRLNALSRGISIDAGGIEAKKQEIKALEEKQKTLIEKEKSFAVLNSQLNGNTAQLGQLEKLGEICPQCLGPSKNEGRCTRIEKLKVEANALTDSLNVLIEEIDDLNFTLKKLPSVRLELKVLMELQQKEAEYKKELSAINPYKTQLDSLLMDLMNTQAKESALSTEIRLLEHRITSLTQIYDLSMELRGRLLRNSVKEMELSTNRYLEKYFDGEIRVEFTLDADKLEVNIQKNGYPCNFKQLSGGQRCLLKLSFGVSLMYAASNKAGVDFGCLMFDEPLAGLDESLKVKAFALFQELETHHDTVLLIDHAPEFKNLFANQYQVKLVGDNSEIELVA